MSALENNPQPLPQLTQVNADAIKLLQNMLAMAERGELLSVVIVSVNLQDSVTHAVSAADQHTIGLVTGLEIAKAKIVSELIKKEQQGNVSPIMRPPRFS